MGRNCRIAGITRDDVCQIAFRYTLFTGAFGHHLGAESCGAMVIPTSSGQTERQIMMMQDLRTTVLHCTPSYAVVLVEKLRELGIDPDDLSLRLGIHGAESMSEEMRRQIEDGLGVTALKDYGLTELGGPGVSIECPHKLGFHINEDYFYPEVINPETLEPVPAGEVGELVFTSLHREALPLIRYRTRDITHLMYDTCDCGRTLVRHGPILGRTDDMLIVGGVNFFPSQLESVLLGFKESAPHYAIHLKKSGPLDVVSADVEAVPEFWGQSEEDTRQRLTQKIETKVKDILGFKIKIWLKGPNTVPRSEGKTKRVFDER
jgi:phenylacetate-CoA ligase